MHPSISFVINGVALNFTVTILFQKHINQLCEKIQKKRGKVIGIFGELAEIGQVLVSGMEEQLVVQSETALESLETDADFDPLEKILESADQVLCESKKF